MRDTVKIWLWAFGVAWVTGLIVGNIISLM